MHDPKETDAVATSESLLVAQDVEAIYGDSIIALRGVSLTVRPGEIVALLGANGAGKTTFLKAVSNLLPAERGRVTHGAVTFEGKLVNRGSAADLVDRGLVQVLEGRRCFKGLTVEENLLTGAVSRRLGRAQTRAGLDRVLALFPQLEPKRRIAAGLVSGGEQQMTAIGRALMAGPRLLLLDEPSMGLAPLVVESIFTSLVRLNAEEGLSLLVAEQNAALGLRHAHRAYVLENGKAVLNGDAAKLRERDDVKAFYLGLAKEQATQAELALAG